MATYQARPHQTDPAGHHDDRYYTEAETYALISAGGVVAVHFVVDGGGSAITTGIKGDVLIPFAATITKWTLLPDVSGSVVFDLWKSTYANYPPTVANTIPAAAKPTISGATKAQSTTLTGWTTAVAADDIIRVSIDSATTITRCALVLRLTRTI
ncbi:MAG TPA: hypothetical protein VNJ04_19750 [Gemmatimonadaceae bacterium]|nr:hypothetical protein [Gemmatimonadaceae bacterium]